MFSDEERRTKPTAALKRLVYSRDKGICRLCNEKVDPFDFDIGHNTAFARGGKLNFKNAILLHPKCNRSMQKLNLKQAREALGMPESQEETSKRILKTLGTNQLKRLAKDNFIKLKPKVEKGWFSNDVVQPSKLQYVNALAKVLNPEQIKTKLASSPKPQKRRRAPKKKSFWSF
ncbi:MAG: HNH endonuclease [Nitrososphaerota archaeon]|nr:HNH endonuclease [Nitrososphaerota archaeon]